MKVLFLNDSIPLEVTPPATHTFNHTKEWIKSKDVEIAIILSFPNFPFGKVYKGYKNKLYQKVQGESKKILEKYKVGLSFIPEDESSFFKPIGKS